MVNDTQCRQDLPVADAYQTCVNLAHTGGPTLIILAVACVLVIVGGIIWHMTKLSGS